MEPRGGGRAGKIVGGESTRKKRKRAEEYPQPSVRGDGGNKVLVGGEMSGILDDAALARGGDLPHNRALARGGKPRRDADDTIEYPEPSVRDNIVLPGGGMYAAAQFSGGVSNQNQKRWRDSDKQPSICAGGTANTRHVMLPGGGVAGIDDAAGPLGGWNPKRPRGDYKTSVDTSNTARPDLICAALKTLPPPPDLVISVGEEEEDKDRDDPVYWALYWRGIEPDNRYRHYMDLYLFNRPEPDFWNVEWKSRPLKLHDAGLVAAVNSMIEWAPGMREGVLDLSRNISCILSNHPGPVSCLRIDSTELPSPKRMKQWMVILTAKHVQELILININLPTDTELPLHHLRSQELKRLCVGFANIRDCLLHAFGADNEESHCWASLKQLNLISCGFDGSDLSYTVKDLFGLKSLTIGHSNLTVGCESRGLILASSSLVSIHLWDCTAETALTVGRAPALKYLTVGVKAVNAPSLLLQIDICEDLRYLDRVALHQQDFRLCTSYQTKIQRKKSIALPYLHTLTVAAQLATADNTMSLLNLLQWFPKLMNLTVWRADSGNGNDEEFPSLDSVASLSNGLEQFTLRDFRGGRGDVSLVLSILDIARKLKSLMVYSHPAMPRTPEEATEFFRSSPRLSKNCAIVVFAPLVE